MMSSSVAPRHAVLLQVLLAIAAGDERNANRINFYNIAPPVDVTPFANGFKCFTCEHASDNYSCNRWAEDKWCPQSTEFCMTMHHFTGRGKTKSVTKRCAGREDCYAVGCQHHRDTGHTECISCCEGMACNVEVPTNHSNAVFAMRQAAPSSTASTNRYHSVLSLLAPASVLLVLL